MNVTHRPKAVIVTGAARGIGQAIARIAAADGWTVVGVDLAGSELQSTFADIPGEHGFVVGDICHESVIEQACEMAVQWAPVKGFVANAGLIGPGASVDYSIAQWNRLTEVMLTASFAGSRVAARWMIETGTGGSIVMTSSVAGTLGFGGRAAYCAAKSGVQGLVRSLAVEWAANKVRVNSVSPGAIDTSLQEAMKNSGHASTNAYLDHIPMKRTGQAHEIAEVVTFLLSDRSSYVTGANIPVDGGWAAHGMGIAET